MSNLLEIINPEANALKARVAVFDFDGTISVIRAGWIDVMVPMMVEPLLALNTGESEEELTKIVYGFVGHLTGRQTIYQMMEFADQIKKRGGTPKDPLEYKHQYLDLLMVKITDRRENLRSGKANPEDWMVPGARRLLAHLVDHERPPHRLALAAAERTVGRQTLEHRPHHHGQEASLELFRHLAHLVRRRRLAQHGRGSKEVGGRSEGAHHITSISA